ncbi:hypothetical protein Peetri_00187 [Pseudomonas phage vB_PpuM-Peetri]
MYTPYSQNSLMQSIPLDDKGTFAHPPYTMEGEFTDVWTNPNLYGFTSLLDGQRNSRTYRYWMTSHNLPALFIGPHHEDSFWFEFSTGLEPTCMLDYNDINIQGGMKDFLERLTASRRRALLKAMETDTVIHKAGTVANFNLYYPVEGRLYSLTSIHERRVLKDISEFIESKLWSMKQQPTDLTYGAFTTLMNHIRLKQREDTPLGHKLRNVQLLVIRDERSGFILSVHLVGIHTLKDDNMNPTKTYLHSFARITVLHARIALLTLIKAVQELNVTSQYASRAQEKIDYIDVSNVVLSEREQYKSDFFTDRSQVHAWASPALLERQLPFIHPRDITL